MPNFDRTGPNRQGSMTGRGMGPCGNGMRRGCCGGFSRGLGFGYRRQVTLTKEEEKEPGKEYVAETARFVITNKGVFTAKSDYDDGRSNYEIEGIKIKRITREKILQMMGE